MNAAVKCLVCYQSTGSREYFYHENCSKRIFGKSQPPTVPYDLSQLDKLAEHIVRSHVTVPGVQRKLSLHFDPSSTSGGRFTLVGMWGNYVLKPPVALYPSLPEIEDLTMHLAALFKIETVPHALIPLRSGELSYITKRIDRDDRGNRIHMEDMCQLTERLTEDKYKGSMEQIGKVIVKYSSNPGFDVLRFFEMALFSFLTGNADMHLKNFSLLHAPNKMIMLTPAYDMVSTRLLISEKDDPEEMALTINGKKSNLGLCDFEVFARTLGLNPKQVENTFRRFERALPAALDFIAKGLLQPDKKEEFRALILSRASLLKLAYANLDSSSVKESR